MFPKASILPRKTRISRISRTPKESRKNKNYLSTRPNSSERTRK